MAWFDSSVCPRLRQRACAAPHALLIYERPHNFIGTRVLPRVRLSDLARAGLETNCSRSTSARGRRHALGLGKHANLIFYLDIERPAERAHARLLVSSAQPHTASMSMSYRLFPGHTAVGYGRRCRRLPSGFGPLLLISFIVVT